MHVGVYSMVIYVWNIGDSHEEIGEFKPDVMVDLIKIQVV